MRRFRLADRTSPILWNWFTHDVVMPYLNGAIGQERRPDRDEMITHLEDRCRVDLPDGSGYRDAWGCVWHTKNIFHTTQVPLPEPTLVDVAFAVPPMPLSSLPPPSASLKPMEARDANG